MKLVGHITLDGRVVGGERISGKAILKSGMPCKPCMEASHGRPPPVAQAAYGIPPVPVVEASYDIPPTSVAEVPVAEASYEIPPPSVDEVPVAEASYDIPPLPIAEASYVSPPPPISEASYNRPFLSDAQTSSDRPTPFSPTSIRQPRPVYSGSFSSSMSVPDISQSRHAAVSRTTSSNRRDAYDSSTPLYKRFHVHSMGNSNHISLPQHVTSNNVGFSASQLYESRTIRAYSVETDISAELNSTQPVNYTEWTTGDINMEQIIRPRQFDAGISNKSQENGSKNGVSTIIKTNSDSTRSTTSMIETVNTTQTTVLFIPSPYLVR